MTIDRSSSATDQQRLLRVYRHGRAPHGLVNLAAVECSTMHWPPARTTG